jgi:GH24 family phage-related lysozyme (muramidase)
MRWVFAGGKKMRGLERRRLAEIALFWVILSV